MILNRPAGSAPQIMLYFSHAIGGGGGSALSRPNIGLRLNRTHLVSGYFKADAPDPMQTRELVNWHFGHGADNRIDFGRRVSWSPSEGSFGRRATEESTFSLPNRTGLALREPVAMPHPVLPVFDQTRTFEAPILATRGSHSLDPLALRADPLELRLDRRGRPAQGSRQTRP